MFGMVVWLDLKQLCGFPSVIEVTFQDMGLIAYILTTPNHNKILDHGHYFWNFRIWFHPAIFAEWQMQ